MNETGTKTVGKVKVFNLIILDRSGSMDCIRRAAIDGFNETLAGIKKAQEKFADTQEHFVSLVAFCGCSTDAIFDKVPVAEARPLELQDYVPCCMTPLFDAMGITMTSMRKHVSSIEDAVVVVTVITDGCENASREYDGAGIKKLVEDLQGEGWTFTYMGANQNAIEVAITMSIKNARNFAYSDDGMKEAYMKDASTRMNFFSKLSKFKVRESRLEKPLDAMERHVSYCIMADEAFEEEEQ